MASIAIPADAEPTTPGMERELGGGAAPTARRIAAMDVVRGVALFGILLMNITGMGMPFSVANNAAGESGADLWAWIVINFGFEGTQRGLFSLLFGAGVILFTSRLEAAGRADAADIYFRRNLWLVAFGCVNSFFLLWIGDILFYYGVTALFLYVFRKLPPKKLLAIGVGVLVLGSAWSAAETATTLALHRDYQAATSAKAAGAKLDEEQKGAIEAWEGRVAEFRPTDAELQERAQKSRSGYASAFLHRGAINLEAQSWMLYRYFADIFGMMIIGMALFKLGVLTLERPARFYVAMTLAGYGVGLAVNAAEVQWIMAHDFSLLATSQANMTYDVGRLPTTLGHLGLLLLFVRSGLLPWLRDALAAVGRMAFTNYIVHSVVALVIFVLLGQFGRLARHELYYIVFAVWAVQLVYSPLWLRHYRFGPLEWLWRYLTYGKRPPFRRTEAGAPQAAEAA
jgi:uncharacterized protein